ncbi:MAG: hypothetical protein RJQ10_05900 [Haliea sp.]|uniref:hypothetical protein n=1 Tax=Haliea sp. TaxID=1932666 RepID=UPI0032ED26C4
MARLNLIVGNSALIGLAFACTPALSQTTDPATATEITLPFSTTVDTGASTISGDNSTVPAPFDGCSVDDQGVFYKFNSGAVTEIDFFAIGEDTEITVSPADDADPCAGGDDDADPLFADVGLSQPSGFPPAPDIDNSELFTGITLDANTDYIVLVGHNGDTNVYDCIAWGIAPTGTPFAGFTQETCPAFANASIGSRPATPVPALPLYSLLALGGLLGLFGLRKLKR